MIQVRFINCTLGYGKKEILKEVNLDISQGDFMWILGPNGSGKTTLLKTLLGLIRPLGGRIERDESLRFGYVMQRQFLDTLFPLTAYEIVSMARYLRAPLFRRLSKADRLAIDRAMETSEIRSLKDDLFRELSEGQKQRVLIGRALAAEPNFLVLDEPTNNMDIKGENQILQLLSRIHRDEGTTVLMVSHLIRVIISHLEWLALISDKKLAMHSVEDIVEQGDLSHIFNMPVELKNINGKKVIVPGE